MAPRNYVASLRGHYEKFWNNIARPIRLRKGPIHQLPRDFSVLCFKPTAARKVWTYATCGMSLPTDPEPLELYLLSPQRSKELVVLLTATAHYHRTGASLGLGHTVNFGQRWLPGSECDHGLISLPYLHGPTLEWLSIGKVKVRFLWLIPITPFELDYKKRCGLEALEERLEEANFGYCDPARASVVSENEPCRPVPPQ
jgi:hypothetical protein